MQQQSMTFVVARVIALQATPALAFTDIELADKRAENVSGLQLIYEVRWWYFSLLFATVLCAFFWTLYVHTE